MSDDLPPLPKLTAGPGILHGRQLANLALAVRLTDRSEGVIFVVTAESLYVLVAERVHYIYSRRAIREERMQYSDSESDAAVVQPVDERGRPADGPGLYCNSIPWRILQ